jgi:hypothetical protein
MKNIIITAFFSVLVVASFGQTLKNATTVNTTKNFRLFAQDETNWYKDKQIDFDSLKDLTNPLKTVWGNRTLNQDSTIYFKNLQAGTLQIDTLKTSKDVKTKPVNDLIYNNEIDKTDFKIVETDNSRISYLDDYNLYITTISDGAGEFNIRETNPVRYRNGGAFIQQNGSFYVERSVRSHSYSMQLETYTNADTLIVQVVDADRKMFVSVNDSIYYITQTNAINNVATYKIPIAYHDGNYRLVTFGMSNFTLFKIGVRSEFKMHKPDYEITDSYGIISDSYGVGQLALTHLDLILLQNKTSDFYINAIGGAGYATFSTMVSKLSERKINKIILFGGFNNFTTSESELTLQINRFLDSCTLYKAEPLIFTPFKSSEAQSYKDGVKRVYKTVVKVAKNHIVYNANNIIFDFLADSIHPNVNGYFQIYEGLKYAFSNQKVLNTFGGLVELSYVPTSSTDLQNEVLVSEIGKQYLLNSSGSWYIVTKISDAKIARTSIAEF